MGIKDSDIFELKDYKDYLINYYIHGCDFNKREERAANINRFYPDDYLNNIIYNTKKFVSYILKRMNDEHNIHEGTIFDNIELPSSYDERSYCISNNCTGGHHADDLLSLGEKSTLISMHLIKKFLKYKFIIYINDEPIEYFNKEENSGGFYPHKEFVISGPINEFKKLYKQHYVKENKEEISDNSIYAFTFKLKKEKRKL